MELGPKRTILIMALGTEFHNGSIYGPSWSDPLKRKPPNPFETLFKRAFLGTPFQEALYFLDP